MMKMVSILKLLKNLFNMTDLLRLHLLIQRLSIILCLSWMPDFVYPSWILGFPRQSLSIQSPI